MAGATLFVAGAAAQTSNDSGLRTNETPGLAVSLLPGESVGREQVIRELIKSGTNEFIFVVPEGMRTQSSSEGIVVLASQDMGYCLSIRNTGPVPATLGLNAALRERVGSKYPQANDLEEFATTVADREGTGLQWRQDLPGVGVRLVRVLWVPFKAGVLEFTLNVDARRAATGQGAFDMILLTFRSNERGKIEVVLRSDKT